MSTLATARTSVQSLEDAFWRRLNKSDDNGAAMLVEELFEEVRIAVNPSKYDAKQQVVVGLKAISLWEALPKDTAAPKTRIALWNAVLEGLLSDPAHCSRDEHKKFTDFLSTAYGGDVFNTLRIVRLKDKLDATHEDRACTEVMNFLKSADMRNTAMTTDMLIAVSKMFGRYAEPTYLMLCAHIYHALKQAANSIRGLDNPNVLRIVAPYMKEMVVRAARLAQVGADMRSAFADIPTVGLTNRDSGKMAITLDWESSAGDAGSADEVARSKSFLAEQAMRVATWRTRNPGAPSFEVVLTTTVRSTKPNGGLSCTFHPIAD